MADNVSLPYIDLGCGAEVLRKYALDNFGKKISPQAKDETVVDRFREIYLDETGITLADIEPEQELNFDDDGPEETTETVAKTTARPQPTAVTINIQEDEKDTHPAVGSHNFQTFRIVRGVDVRVSINTYHALKDAQKDVLIQKTALDGTVISTIKSVQTYPFSIVEWHYD